MKIPVLTKTQGPVVMQRASAFLDTYPKPYISTAKRSKLILYISKVKY